MEELASKTLQHDRPDVRALVRHDQDAIGASTSGIIILADLAVRIEAGTCALPGLFWQNDHIWILLM